MIAMRYFVLVCCMVAMVVAEEKYDSKYDNIDVKEVVENKRLFLAYVECIMEKGKCTPEGTTLKEHMHDALETGCEKCTEPQKKGTIFVIEHLIKNEPAIWNELCEKYDPTGKYRKKYEDLAKEHGIEIPAPAA